MSPAEIAYRIGWTLFLGAGLLCFGASFPVIGGARPAWLRRTLITTAIVCALGLLIVLTTFIWTGDHEGVRI